MVGLTCFVICFVGFGEGREVIFSSRRIFFVPPTTIGTYELEQVFWFDVVALLATSKYDGRTFSPSWNSHTFSIFSALISFSMRFASSSVSIFVLRLMYSGDRGLSWKSNWDRNGITSDKT